MANSCILTDKQLVSLNGTDYRVRQYQIAIDTINTDLTIHTPQTDMRSYVLGMFASEDSATHLSFFSQSPTLNGTISQVNGSAVLTGANPANFSLDFLAGGAPFKVLVTGGAAAGLVISSVDNDLQMT